MKENKCSMCENYLSDMKACSIAEMNFSASKILSIRPHQEACHNFKEMELKLYPSIPLTLIKK
jgi:hypothetical protein